MGAPCGPLRASPPLVLSLLSPGVSMPTGSSHLRGSRQGQSAGMTGASHASSADQPEQSNDFEETYSSVLQHHSNAERPTSAAKPRASRTQIKPATKDSVSTDETQASSERVVVPVKIGGNMSRFLSIQISGKSSASATPATLPNPLLLATTSLSDRAKTIEDADSEAETEKPMGVTPDLSSENSAPALSQWSIAVLSPAAVDPVPATDAPAAKTPVSGLIGVPTKAMPVRIVSPESADPQFLSFGLTLKPAATETEKPAPVLTLPQTPANAVQTPTEPPVANSEMAKGIAELKRAPKPSLSPNPPTTGSKGSSSNAAAPAQRENDEPAQDSLVPRAIKIVSGGDVPQEHGHTGYSANGSEAMPELVKSEVKPANSLSPTAAVLAGQPDQPTLAPANPNQLVLRIQSDSGQNISVRVQDQGGQVQVAVRSSDPATASILSQQLPVLQSNLQQAGWKSELFLPNPVVSADSLPVSSPSMAQNDAQNSNGQHSGPDWSGFDDAPKKQATIQQLWNEMLDRQSTTV